MAGMAIGAWRGWRSVHGGDGDRCMAGMAIGAWRGWRTVHGDGVGASTGALPLHLSFELPKSRTGGVPVPARTPQCTVRTPQQCTNPLPTNFLTDRNCSTDGLLRSVQDLS
jgi:hypothetical protein